MAPWRQPRPAGPRFLAGVIDQALLTVVFMAVMALAGLNPMDFIGAMNKGIAHEFAAMLPYLAGMMLYYGLTEGIWGAAAGKALCRLRVVGPDRNPPGFRRALVRALIYLIVPGLPFWLTFGFNPKAYYSASTAVQTLMGFSWYIIQALLFSTARRRNGLAAMQDLATKHPRHLLRRSGATARAGGGRGAPACRRRLADHRALSSPGKLEKSSQVEWLLGYDLRLLRKVWIRGCRRARRQSRPRCGTSAGRAACAG